MGSTARARGQNEMSIEKLDQLIRYAAEHAGKEQAAEFEQFLRIYYGKVESDDLAGVSVENLYGSAYSFWQFAEQREPGTTAVRVFNPRTDKHGWNSSHTAIELVNDDMPFLFDSVTMELASHSRTIHLSIHPVLHVIRDGKCKRQGLDESGTASGSVRESMMHIEIDEQTDPKALKEIEKTLITILSQVREVVGDWKPCLAELDKTIETLIERPPKLPKEDVDEAVEFLKWLGDNHFTFLGYRAYDLSREAENVSLEVVEGSGLGLLRNPDYYVLAGSKGRMTSLSEEVLSFLREPQPIIITKANRRSPVHRAVHLDYVGVKRFDDKGQMIGECRFIGLFTSVSYNRSPLEIPLLRRKVRDVVEQEGFPMDSHNGKALINILENFPRDELFQISPELLHETGTGIMHLEERPRARVFVRPDRFERYVSALVYLPRETYNTRLRLRVEEILCRAYEGTISAHFMQVDNSTLARLHLIVRTKPGERPDPDLAEMQVQVEEAARSWSDVLHAALVDRLGEEAGNRLWSRYEGAFPASYQETVSPDFAIIDIEKIETLNGDQEIALNFYRSLEDAADAIRFKIYHRGGAIPLSDVLPMLEGMGLKVMEEHPSNISGGERDVNIWMHDFHLCNPTGEAVDLDALKDKFEEAFRRVWHGQMDNDRFNVLVLRAGLGWREIFMLRGLAKYLRQIRVAFSQSYMEDTLAAHPEITRRLVDMFATRFDPDHETAGDDKAREGAVAAIRAEIVASLEQVSSLDEDRIIRRFLNLIDALLRTNYYQPAEDGAVKPYASYKFDSAAVDELPLPRPFVEVFVYSRRVEGIHLRGGKVARGGLRWSDRREDFRTEVLGLMKAQMVKNVVIVPVGAKGGFVPKHLPQGGSREDFIAEGVECYKIFIRGLLDITDNLAGDDIVPPARVVRYDGDDPYLVVAADKGTATFSDIANGVSDDYGFWLSDAFASGGSVGYDHKKMGITARGAWVSVARHFREIGIDVQKTPFTVAGIGDMSGDVFGNGMLLSDKIMLLAAFDHRHVFIDPDPDPAKSFKERRRLFELPRSSWADYETKLISKGGGVFDRAAKSVEVTPEIRELFGIADEKITPAELMRAILGAKVDLLWVGGIGTYVKGRDETNLEVDDRANDNLRINGAELRCKVVGEGGNLGLTQRGRIEYGRAGGRLNTDAIDNAGGVNCSDREVNIKILLNGIVADGDMTMKQRNALLEEMTGEVADLVLLDNYRQAESISMIAARAPELLDSHARFIRLLQKRGLLDREVEFLPDDEELDARAARGEGLTRPEISVLLAYAKMTLYQALLETDIPGDKYLSADLGQSFPKQLRSKYKKSIGGHRLRREIAATLLSNNIVNRAGPTFFHQLQEEQGVSADELARAYLIVRDVFDLKPMWIDVGKLDNQVDAAVQTEMVNEVADLLRRETMWFLNNIPAPMDVTRATADYQPGITELCENMEDVLSKFEAKALKGRVARFAKRGVPEPLAQRIAAMETLASGCDIVRVANESGRPVTDVARIYFEVGAQLGLDWLRAAAEKLAAEDRWDRLAIAALIEDLFGQQRQLTSLALAASNGAAGSEAVALWKAENQVGVERTQELISELRDAGAVNVSKLTFASRHVRRLISD